MLRGLGFALLLLSAAMPGQATPQVRIAQGALRGTAADGVFAFKDIPFAAPPIGPLRWRAPMPAPNWSGVRDATHFGPLCPQPRLPLAERLARRVRLPESEDCLTLNAWTPSATAGVALPVMVWIYGGSFQTGGAALPIYDGAELSGQGVVVVTFNYRLGRLGFFDLPALAAETPGEPVGNYGLLDQIAALAWVKRNISAFGGDPANVTIFGESAGGISVNELMVSPLARGLFAKAISESGLGLAPIPTAAAAQQDASAFAARAGAHGDTASVLARLRSLPVETIVGGESAEPEGVAVAPMVDGKVLPDQQSVLFARGEFARVPYLAGWNSDEASLMPAVHLTAADMFAPFGGALPAVRAIYEQSGKLSDAEFARRLFDDSWFACGAQGLASFVAGAGAPAYAYHFAYVAEPLRALADGVGHGGEIPYVFGLRGLARDPVFASAARMATSKDLRIVAMMQAYWTNFAKTGNPNGPGLPQWTPTTPAATETLVVGDETKTVADFRKDRLAVMYRAFTRRTGQPAPE